MATFEQALDKAFEVTWQHSLDLDATRAEAKEVTEEHVGDLMIAGAEQAFIGSVDVLGSLLRLAARIPVFALSSSDEQGDWADGSSATLVALMEWAREKGRVDDAEYAAWLSIYGPDRKKITQ